MVVYYKTNIQRSHGVAIYFPNDNKELLDKWLEAYKEIDCCDNYEIFLDGYVAVLTGESIADWDIEVKGGTMSVFLAYFMKQHKEVEFPQEVALRLKGLLDFYKFANMEKFAFLSKYAKELQKENIDIMLIKGAAMKQYRPDLPRVMEDIDILVRSEEDYKKALAILEREDFTDNKIKHSIYFQNKENNVKVLDIHSKLSILSDSAEVINGDLFARASKQNFCSIENVYIPCPEDILFIICINFF